MNGKPADAFYAQFTNDKSKGGLEGAASFDAQPNGDNAWLATIFLMPDKSFVLYYTEGQGDVTLDGHTLATHPDRDRKVTGNWSVDGTTLKVGDTMSCEGLTYNGHDAVSCKLEKAIGYEAGVGQAGMFELFGPSTPNDSQWSDYK